MRFWLFVDQKTGEIREYVVKKKNHCHQPDLTVLIFAVFTFIRNPTLAACGIYENTLKMKHTAENAAFINGIYHEAFNRL
jgi:hypothetical protein